jgi:hypothetical protein
VTPRAARARAFRARWPKLKGNDGRARVRLPDEPCAPPRNTTVRPTDSALVTALREHNHTLKVDVEQLKAQLSQRDAQLAEANARADKAIAALRKTGGRDFGIPRLRKGRCPARPAYRRNDRSCGRAFSRPSRARPRWRDPPSGRT